VRFLVSFKSHNKAVKPQREQMMICAPDDMYATEWGKLQASYWGQVLDISVGIVEDDLDEYIASRNGFSPEFATMVNEAVQRREDERHAAKVAEENE
jgi:hypothetical protein